MERGTVRLCGFRHISTSGLGVSAGRASFIVSGRPLQVTLHSMLRNNFPVYPLCPVCNVRVLWPNGRPSQQLLSSCGIWFAMETALGRCTFHRTYFSLDHRLDTGIVFRICQYWQIQKVVSPDCAARRCTARHALAGIAIATMTSSRHRLTTDSDDRRALAEVCTVSVLLVKPVFSANTHALHTCVTHARRRIFSVPKSHSQRYILLG